jgi:three-Cys-motif partner protein
MTHHKGSQANTFHRDASRVIESHPQTGHKVAVIDEYYGQHPEILIAAAKTTRIDASHIWLIEVCAGAGTYLSAEHPSGYIDGCALRACAKAKDIQRRHRDVTMHVVLVEPDPQHCAELGRLIRPYVDTSGRNRVDVKIESARFEDCVERILARTARPGGGYYYSLWFIDPDGIVELPHAAVSCIAAVRRGPEIIINLSATGLARVKSATMSKPGDWEHASVAGNRKLMNTVFGNDSWQAVLSESSHAIYLGRLASAYAETFPTFQNRQICKLRTNGDEVRYLPRRALQNRSPMGTSK